MRISAVAYQVPDPEGTGPGRALWAWCTGMRELGHDVTVWSWGGAPPRVDPPPWCTWRPLPTEPALRTRLRAVARPRSDVVRAGWRPDGGVALADDVPSFAAIAGGATPVVTLHYLARLDAAALRRWTPRSVQDVRADRRAARAAGLVLAYSARVAAASGGRRAAEVPIAYPAPDRPVDPVDAPRALLLADWAWAPNRLALDALMRCWPTVSDAVPGASLVLAGRASDRLRVGHVPGVELAGPVARVADVLADAAVVAFPCPATSGPKVKVLEALAHGVPAVTTAAGVEGLAVGPDQGVVVARGASFGDELAALLRDPARRAALGAAGRDAVLRAHSPLAAARARERALSGVPAVGDA